MNSDKLIYRIAEIFVIYEDGSRERIWTFDPAKYDFDHRDFIVKTKKKLCFIATEINKRLNNNSRNLHTVLWKYFKEVML